MKQLTQITPEASTHWVGDGFPVRNLISIPRDARDTSPFLMLDFAGPYDFKPASAPRGVGEHPHRGFETVTIVYQGEVAHRDTSGNSGVIGPGDVQWMTAASGVLHEEFHSPAFTQKGGTLEMAQLWVNLPAREKMSAPRYQAILDAQIPAIALPKDAGSVRVIAGDYEGTKGPALTYSPINVWDLRLNTDHRVAFTLPEGWTTLVVVLRGQVAVGDMTIVIGQTAHFTRAGNAIAIKAEKDSLALLLSGKPLDEPIAHYGPFVMNTEKELSEAIDDFRSGRFGKLEHGY
ncbi:MAG: putative quercetin 2,3-dioxygenase [Chromatiales bacterium USCg_Taylor]|nr:MAG: putative quercetin 2,3-dioxygenase [Chromatiales bacterium USCg_Taylor]